MKRIVIVLITCIISTIICYSDNYYNGIFVDDLIAPYIEDEVIVDTVKISISDDNIVTVINPFKRYTNNEHNLIIDCSNSDKVIVKCQETGIPDIKIESLGSLHTDKGKKQSIIKLANYYGLYNGNVIKFSHNDFNLYVNKDTLRTNVSGRFMIFIRR